MWSGLRGIFHHRPFNGLYAGEDLTFVQMRSPITCKISAHCVITSPTFISVLGVCLRILDSRSQELARPPTFGSCCIFTVIVSFVWDLRLRSALSEISIVWDLQLSWCCLIPGWAELGPLRPEIAHCHDKALNQEAWSENAPLNDGSQNVRTGLQVSTSKRKLVWEEVSLKNILKPITLTVSLLIVL